MTVVEIRVGERTAVAHLAADGLVRIDDASFGVQTIGEGLYRVSDDARHWTVAVAGPAENRWVFVNGQVAELEASPALAGHQGARQRGAFARGRPASPDLSSPMPATVIRVLAEPGVQVSRGDTLLMLEAMKMELAIRAPRDGVVGAIHCKAGDLVQAGVTLLDLE